MKPVSDPALLQQLEGGLKPVSDPNLLSQLEPKKGFIERVGDHMTNRSQINDEITQARKSGEQGYIESGFQKAGKVGAGFLNDVAGEALVEGGKALSYITPDAIEKPIIEAGKDVLNYTGNTSAGRAAMGLAQDAVQGYESFAENNPRSARNIESLANTGVLAAALTPVKSQAIANTVVDKAGEGVKTLAKKSANTALAPVKGSKNLYQGIKAGSDDALDAASKTIKDRSTKAYSDMRNAGATFKAGTTNRIIQNMDDALKSDGILNPRLHDKVVGLMDDFKARSLDGEMALEELDQWRQLFGEVSGNFGDKINARKASIVRNALDDAIDSISPSDLASGDKTAVQALKTARAEWARQSKFNTIKDVIKKSDGDANYLKRELKKIYDNPKKHRGFSADEMAALKEASKLSFGEGVLKIAGKFGFDLGGSRIGNGVAPLVGGFAAGTSGGTGVGLAVPAVGTVARQGQKYVARGKAENLLDTIKGNKQKQLAELLAK